MDKQIHRILCKIGTSDPRRANHLGKLITPILFTKGNAALLVYGHETYLLVPENTDDNEVREKLIRVYQFCALITQLEKEGIIIVIDDENDTIDWLYYVGATKFHSGSIDGLYQVGKDNMTLKRSDNGSWQLNDNGLKMKSVEIDPSNAGNIYRTLSSVVYPTLEFADYKLRKFRTPSQYSLRQAVRANIISTIALIVTLAIAAISPVIQHNCVKTTISSQQFDSIMSAVEKSTTIHLDCDSVAEILNALYFDNHVQREKQK